MNRKLYKFNGLFIAILLIACITENILAQSFQQTQADDYTRYELLAPETHSFRIYYDVTATTAGAENYFNSIRLGSEATVNNVHDLMTGQVLEWQVVDGKKAKEAGHARANPERHYIQIKLARAVPRVGGVRIRIDKTYKDTSSYFFENNVITFSRTLGIKRNAIVLPKNYEIIACNYPSQIAVENNQIKVSFMNRAPTSIPFELKGRILPESREKEKNSPVVKPDLKDATPSPGNRDSVARIDYTFSERAFQNRDIVYFLQQPETHSFFLYHDYTEDREGVDKYLNIVRKGSQASEPSAVILDSAEELKVEKLTGEEISRRGVDIGRAVTPETEVVVIWFEPVKKGQSIRLRIAETYTDPNRYLLVGKELVWDRQFGRPRNTLILPEGWYVIANSVPAVIDETEDGKIRFYYVNDRPGNIEVFVKAKQR